LKSFALIAPAGYIAPKHLEAIQATGNSLVAAYDKSDSVGIIDHYFPQAKFFTEFERFDRHLEKLKINGTPVDYLVVCSPNYLHDAHIRFGLKHGMEVICEKPLVLNPWNLDALAKVEKETGQIVNTILQLRLHKNAIALKQKIEQLAIDKKQEVELTYITSRGSWYYASWKGDLEKSGGIATNIGIHFFDLLMWVFGAVQNSKVYQSEHDRMSGYLELEKANVKWFLSINEETLPQVAKDQNLRTYRSIKLDGEEFEFSGGFTDLHIESYKQILAGNGFGIKVVRPSIDLVHKLRSQELSELDKNAHTSTNLPLSKHPFS